MGHIFLHLPYNLEKNLLTDFQTFLGHLGLCKGYFQDLYVIPQFS